MNHHDPTQIVWACTSVGSCVASFLAFSIPILQVIALTVSIFAGWRALRGRKDKDQDK